MTERALTCPHCGRALLGLEHELRKCRAEIDRLRQLFVDQGRRTSLVADRNGALYHWGQCKWPQSPVLSTCEGFALAALPRDPLAGEYVA